MMTDIFFKIGMYKTETDYEKEKKLDNELVQSISSWLNGGRMAGL